MESPSTWTAATASNSVPRIPSSLGDTLPGRPRYDPSRRQIRVGTQHIHNVFHSQQPVFPQGYPQPMVHGDRWRSPQKDGRERDRRQWAAPVSARLPGMGGVGLGLVWPKRAEIASFRLLIPLSGQRVSGVSVFHVKRGPPIIPRAHTPRCFDCRQVPQLARFCYPCLGTVHNAVHTLIHSDIHRPADEPVDCDLPHGSKPRPC